jgi:hypothetical protein
MIAAKAGRQNSFSRPGPALSYIADMEFTLGIWVNEKLSCVQMQRYEATCLYFGVRVEVAAAFAGGSRNRIFGMPLRTGT